VRSEKAIEEGRESHLVAVAVEMETVAEQMGCLLELAPERTLDRAKDIEDGHALGLTDLEHGLGVRLRRRLRPVERLGRHQRRAGRPVDRRRRQEKELSFW